MRLPPELRILIYKYALRNGWTIKLNRRRLEGQNGPALCLVSREVREESLPVYFRCNTFLVRSKLFHFDQLGQWLERLADWCGPRVFRGIRFQVLDGPWSQFAKIWRLVKLLADGKIKLNFSQIDIEATPPQRHRAKAQSLFRMSKGDGGYYLQLGFEEAVLLGRKAKKKHWTEDELSEEFEVLVERHQSGAAVSEKTRKKRKKREAKRLESLEAKRLEGGVA